MELISNDSSIYLDLNGELKLDSFHIGGAKVSNVFSSKSGESGVLLRGSKIGARSVKLEGYIVENIEENRRALCKLCTLGTPFWIVDGTYKLEVTLESGIEFSSEKRFTDKLFRFTLNAVSLNPYWLGRDLTSLIFYNCGGESTDTNAIVLTNEGELPTGFTIRALMMSSCNFLVLRKGDKQIYINRPFNVMDSVLIDTRCGQKSVTVTSSDGTVTNIIDYVTPSSEFFELDEGENRIDFIVSQGVSYMIVEYYPKYLR